MPKSFIFNNGFSGSTGLSFDVNRNWSVTPIGDDGNPLNSSTAGRYTRAQRLLCAAPVVTQHVSGGQVYACAGGVSYDGTTPLFVYENATSEYLEIWRDAFGAGAGGTLIDTNTGLRYPHADSGEWLPKRGQFSILRGTANDNANDGKIYVPKLAFAVCHGLIVALCEVKLKRDDITFNVTGYVSLGSGVYGLAVDTGFTFNPFLGVEVYIGNATYPYRIVSVSSAGGSHIVTISDDYGNGSVPSGTVLAKFPQWGSSAVAVCARQITSPGDVTEWGVYATGPASQNLDGHERCSFFSWQGARILQTDSSGAILECWFPFADYAINFPDDDSYARPSSKVANFYLIRAHRANVSSAWEFDELAQVKQFTSETAPMHSHSPYVERYSDNGLRLICPVGDSQGHNRVAAAYIDDQDDYETPGNWTVYDNLNGKQGDISTPGDSRCGNQFIGNTPLGTTDDPGGHVVGADEMGVPLAMLAPLGSAAPDDPLFFTRVWGQWPASSKRGPGLGSYFNWQVFTIICELPEWGWNHVAHMSCGNVGLDIGGARLLFSPNGLAWGECFAVRHPINTVAIFDGAIWTGSLASLNNGAISSYGLRSMPVPVYALGHPLIVGRGGRNLISPTADVLTGTPGSGNTASVLTSLPSGVPAPPCSGPVFQCELVTDRELGEWRLTQATQANVPRASSGTNLRLRAYLYPLDGALGGTAGCVSLVLAIGQSGNINSVTTGSREEFFFPAVQCRGDSSGGWIPITIDTNTSDWTRDDGSSRAPNADPFVLSVRVRCQWDPTSACKFLVAFDSLHCDTSSPSGVIDHPGIALPLDGTLYDPELPKVTGFNCGESWTMEVVGEIPDDASDHTVPFTRRPLIADRVLCSFSHDQVGAITAHADMEHRQVVFRIPGVTGDVVVEPGDHEDFFFTRGSAIFLAVTCSYFGGLAHYICYASVGHSSIEHSETVAGTALRPDTIFFCGADDTAPECMLWWGGRANESSALSASEIESSWANLSLFPTIANFTPPWPPEN